jgi:hypothetical protein
MKRVLFATCAAALLLAPMALWAEGQDEAAADVTEMTWMSQYADSYAYKDMQERFGVTVTSNEIFENDGEKRQAMLAAGEQPDFGNFWGNPVEFYQDGVTRAIPKAWIREYAPNLSQMYDNYPLAWNTWENPDNPDELLAINGISLNTDGNLMLPFFRYDNATEAGLELPGYDEGKVSLDVYGRVYYYEHDMTWDEMGDLLRGFRDVQPGTVEIPLGACNLTHWCLNQWLGAFGIRGDGTNREVDGQLYYFHTDPGMKEFIKAFGAWFGEGLIDRELPTLNRDKYWEKGQAGLYGVQSEPYTNAGQTYAMYRTPNNMVPDEDLGQPGAEVVGIPPIIGPGGERGGRAYSAIAGVGNYKFYASDSVSDAKLIKMLEMLDFYMGTMEGWIIFRNGKEGVHFDWDGEPFESFARERTESELPEGAGHGRLSVYPVFYTLDRLKIIAPRPLADFQSGYALVDGGVNVYTTRSHRADFRTETEFEDLRQRFMSTLNTMWSEFFYKGITGQIDVDAEWDAYVEAWSDAGGADIVAELAKAPIVEEFRQGRWVY